MSFDFSYKWDDEYGMLTLSCVKGQAQFDKVLEEYAGRDIKHLSVMGDWLDVLHVPDGVEIVCCGYLGLKEISLPDSVEMLYADYNKLSNIILPAGIIKATLRENLLETIEFKSNPYRLEELDLNSNRISILDFVAPETFYQLDIGKNFHLKSVTPDIDRVINQSDIDGPIVGTSTIVCTNGVPKDVCAPPARSFL